MRKMFMLLSTMLLVAGCAASSTSKYGVEREVNKFQKNLITVKMKGGVIDTDLYIIPGLGFAKGDPTNGLAQYSFAGFGVANGNCELCHGNDGRLINFGSAASPEYLGALSRGNPWEVLHKARFGQPNSNMPAMIQSGLTLDDAVDVLTHSQSLPE